MSDQQTPAVIAREAKSIHQGLKEVLKKKEPFDKEVDFQRKNLRRRYLLLLLVHPYAKESQDAENHLWMQTSYLFISSYKQHIGNLDRIINRQQQNGGSGNSNNNGGHGPVEYRKLVQRFRQFLADEEKFWTKLVLRFRRSFALDEAHPALVKLGLALDSDAGDSPADGRNHYQFPPETSSVAPATPEQQESRLNILSKALVCLGDIARYREVYNDGGGRSRIGHDDAPRRGRGRRGGAPAFEPVRPRNYTKARNCYEQAKLLFPTDGNPSHQLAILASYEKDQFTSLVHYYFALCVNQPYDTASDNMGTILSKALEQWKTRSKTEQAKGQLPTLDMTIPKLRIDAFKEKVVVLHALWRIGLQKMEPIMVRESNGIYTEFKSLISERHLLEEFIPQVLITSQGALWTHRMIRGDRPKKSRDSSSPTLTPSDVEARIFGHLLLLYRALLEVGLQEIKSVEVTDTDLAQRITATFRRTLRALRVIVKWLRANMKYMVDAASADTNEFWRVMGDFVRALSTTFPIEELPGFTSMLEEDREMEGFLPLKGLLTSRTAAVSLTDEHPNIVHLMRIGDILNDAQWISDFEGSPLKLSQTFQATVPSVLPSSFYSDTKHKDDDMMTVTTDPVAEAFDHLKEQELDDDDDMDDDQVLYPRASISPIPPVIRESPGAVFTPIKLNSPLSPIGHPPSPIKTRSPPSMLNASKPLTPAASMTAQDLLFSDVLGGKRLTSNNFPTNESQRGAFPVETRTIWSTSSDELHVPQNQTYPHNDRRFGFHDASSSQSQSSWPPALPSSLPSLQSTQGPQTYLPSAPFALPPQTLNNLNPPPHVGPGGSLGYGGNFSPDQSPYHSNRYAVVPPSAGMYPPDAYYSPMQPIGNSMLHHSQHMPIHDPRQAFNNMNLAPLSSTSAMWGPVG